MVSLFNLLMIEQVIMPFDLAFRNKAAVIHLLLDCVQTHHNYMPGNVFQAKLTKLQRSIEVATSGMTMIIENEWTTAHRITKSIP